MRISKPVTTVFQAFIDPAITAGANKNFLPEQSATV
jgi:hypothetical protein